MRVHRWNIPLLIWGQSALLAAFAALITPPATAQMLPLQRYAIKEGLPSNRIMSLLQDSRGYLWVGTGNGLARYDGTQFNVYHTIAGLSDDFITTLLEDKQTPGELWIGTYYGGLWKYANDSISLVIRGEDENDASISGLAYDSRGRLWCATTRGLKLIDRDGVRWVRRLESNPWGTMIATSPSGRLYASFSDSLFFLDGEMPVALPLPGDTGSHIVSMYCDSSDGLWVAYTRNTLLRYSHSGIELRLRIAAFISPHMVDDGRGSLWLSTTHALWKIPIASPSDVTTYGVEDGFPGMLDSPLLVDRERNFWIGSWADGLVKLSHLNFRTYLTAGPERTDRNVFGNRDPDSRFWISVAGRVLELYPIPGGRLASQFHSSPAVAEESSPMRGLLAENDLLYCPLKGPNTGLRYQAVHTPGRPSRLRPLPRLKIDEMAVGSIPLLYRLRNGGLVAGIFGLGLVFFDSRETTPKQTLQLRDGLPGATIVSLFEDDAGDLWAGDFHEGVAHLRKRDRAWEIVRTYSTKDGLPDNHIRSFCEDARHRIWIGTRYGGAVCLDGAGLHSFSIKDGLHGNAVWSLAADTRGTVWAGTDFGMEPIDSRQMQVVHCPSFLRGELVVNCGMIGDSAIWYLTPYTLNLYTYADRQVDAVPPPVHIQSFEVNGARHSTKYPIELKSNEDNCVIGFTGLSFRDDGVQRYKYLLEGIDHEWQTTTQRAVTLAGLSPGLYTFKVFALNSDGIMSTEPAVLAFRVLPPFWRQWWFIMIANGVVLGVIVLGALRRVNALQKEKRLQQEFSRQLISAQEDERKRIASEMHDSIGQNILIIKNHALLGLQSADPDSASSNHLSEIASLSSEAVNQVKEISYNLRPYQIDRIGLTKALQSIVTRVSGATPIACTSDIENIDNLVQKENEIIIYRLVQEAMNNVVQHSGSPTASVIIKNDDTRVSIVIADSGIGFSADSASGTADGKGGLGLRSIAERVRIMNGILSVDTAPGRGTRITVHIPLKDGR